MFEEYQNAVTKAVSDSSKSKNDFTNKRESLTIEIKNTLANECDSIEDTTLADYNPLKIHNEITKLKHQFNQLFVDEEEAQKKIKDDLSEESIHSSALSSRSVSPSKSSLSETPDEKRLRLAK